MTKYVECLECGTGMYQIVKGDGIIGHAFTDYGLYQALGKIRLELGRLSGVHVYDTNGTRLKAKAVADLMYDYVLNGAK